MARISRDEILDCALQIAERDGLAGVSMRAVARQLDVTPMALYRHVADKQELLDGLVERLLLEIASPDPELPIRERFLALADAMRDVARRHPDAFLLLFQRPALTDIALTRRAELHDALRAGGVPEELVARVERLLSTFLLGFAGSEAGGRFSQHTRETLDADLAWLVDLALS